ncbi:UNVERIFIED_ORG: hypothetical protein GGE11_005369 [Mycolicibacterium obuense]
MTSGDRIVLTRWTPGLALSMVVFTALLWVVPLVEAFRAGDDRGERISFGVASALLAIPFLWVCLRIPKTLRGMGIEVDEDGVHPFDGARTDTIAWHEIAAVGFGARIGTFRRASTRRLTGLEIYLTDAAHASRHPRLEHDWQDLAPPARGLSAGCYRFTVSPYGAAAQQVERAVRRFRPHLWRGPFVHEGAGQRVIG